MNTKFREHHSGKVSALSLLTPLLLLGVLTVFSQVKLPALAEDQTAAATGSTASALCDPHFARTWAITLRNQYHTADTYRRALRQTQILSQHQSLELRYCVAARQYNRMASEAPESAFQTLAQPRALPLP